jgi:hypothetical protein
MLSFDELRQRSILLKKAIRQGLSAILAPGDDAEHPCPDGLRIFLDNGAFACLRRGDDPAIEEFRSFVAAVRPTWYPVPADFIPLPSYSKRRQRSLFERTVAVLEAHRGDNYCPVVHPGPWMDNYLDVLHRLGQTRQLALGGLVPHLLNSPGARRRQTIALLKRVRREFPGRIHAFGIGGIVTLHLAAALGINTADSSGWRQRAARGLILLRGRGERQAVKLGSWLGRSLTPDDWRELHGCRCPSCRIHGNAGLRAEDLPRFVNRAIHNLHVLLAEASLINRHLAAGDFSEWSTRRLRGNRMANLVTFALERDS